MSSIYRKHGRTMTNSYEHIIREVEHATFTPLVNAATGSLASEANTFYNRLVSLLTMVWNNSYSSTLHWLHYIVSYSLVCSARGMLKLWLWFEVTWTAGSGETRVKPVCTGINFFSNTLTCHPYTHAFNFIFSSLIMLTKKKKKKKMELVYIT